MNIVKKFRSKVRDVAFQFRMGAGFVGDVNRTHPASIEPTLIDASAPPTAFGQAVVVDATTQGVRPLVAGDSGLTTIYGVTVRPFPLQASSGTAFGGAALDSSSPSTPPVTGVIDTLRAGYIIVKVPVGQTPVKGGTVYIWVASSSGSHVQGGFEASSTGGSTITLATNETSFNGSPDSSGFVELAFNI